jgi:hypothetical protein
MFTHMLWSNATLTLSSVAHALDGMQDFLDLVPFPTQLLGHGHRDSNSTAPLQHLVTNLWIGARA